MDCTIQVHRKKLGKIIYQKRAVVSTQDPRTIRDYIKQMYRWHSGAWQVGLKYEMLTGLSKIDLEYKLLMGEGLIFATLFLLLPLWLVVSPRLAFYAVGMDMVVLGFPVDDLCSLRSPDGCLSLLASVSVLAVSDCGIFLYSFWKIVVQKKQVRGWFAGQTVLTRKVEL